MLTDTAIRRAKPGEKPMKLFDGKGLFLLVNKTGSKLWRLKYRFEGKEKLLALGAYPEVRLAEARSQRDEARALLAEGIDPGEARKAEKQTRERAAANSFEAIAREWHGKQEAAWTKGHAATVLRRLETNLFPDLGRKAIDAVEAPELLATVRKIEARGAHDLAHRVLTVSGQIFRYGIATGRCRRDPAADLRGALTPHKPQHQPAIRPEDLPELLHGIETYDGDALTKLALQLMAATFVRTSELIGARWEEIDGENALWSIPAERMKMKTEHLVPLSRQALALLAQIKPLEGRSAFVFPGRNRDKPISNNTMLYALYRMGYKGRMTGHGFRAIASTIMNESGRFRSDVVERQLAHTERNQIRAAYNRAEYLDERRDLMQWWGDYLEHAQEGGKVVPFRQVA